MNRTLSLQAEVNGILNGTIQPTALQEHRFNALSVPMNDPDGRTATRPNRNAGSHSNHTHNRRIYLSVGPNADGEWYLPNPQQTNPNNSHNWADSPWTTSDSLPVPGRNDVPSADDCTPYDVDHPANPLLFDFVVCEDRIAYRMTWPWVFDNFSVRWVASRLIGPGTTMSANQFVNAVLSRRPANVKNQHLDVMCDTIKAEDIPIFTVAFEAPPGGVSAMQSCASSLNHFYDVEGTDISTAFRAIAGTINRLRLTQ